MWATSASTSSNFFSSRMKAWSATSILLAVKVAVEVEQMRLEQLGRRLEGRADAEAGDAGMLAAVLERHPHRIDAVAAAAGSRRASMFAVG